MNVLFIKLDSRDSLNVTISPPLGIMYLASYLKQNRPGKDNIEILDLRCCSRQGSVALHNTLAHFKPDIVGISCLTMEHWQMQGVAATVKKMFPKTIIVVGGPHANAYPEEVLDKYVDYAVLGEGELTFLELIECIEQKEDAGSINSICFRLDKDIIFTPKRKGHIDIDGLPYPAWNLVDLNYYYHHPSMMIHSPRRYMCVMTSRGCPYGCIFCHNVFGREFRGRSIDNIIKELKILKKAYGIHDIEIMDDCFNFDKQRARDFFIRLIEDKINIKISFPNGLRADLLDEEIVKLMKKAGVVYTAIAVETASLRLQRLIGKNLDLQKTREIINCATKNGIFVNGFFISGLPTETKKDMKETISFALNSALCQANFFLFLPFKNPNLEKTVPIGESKAKEIKNKLFSRSYSDSDINLSRMSDKQLNLLRLYANIRFYFSVRRLLYLLNLHPEKNFSLAVLIAKRLTVTLLNATIRAARNICNVIS